MLVVNKNTQKFNLILLDILAHFPKEFNVFIF